MGHFKTLLLSLFFAGSLSAQPFITSITPSTGSVAGGTTVTVTGSGFESCPVCSPAVPPAFSFGGVSGYGGTIVDDHTMLVQTPAHLPGTVDVVVEQWNGSFRKTDAFTFTGQIGEGLETLLLPVLLPPIPGAYGSEFLTELRGRNNGPYYMNIFGLKPVCVLSACIEPDLEQSPMSIAPAQSLEELSPEHTGKPGVLLYVPKGDVENLSLNLRVHDTSRDATNFGTEIPIPRASDFRHDRFALLGVPVDSRFRLTLRLYSTWQTETIAHLTIGSFETDVHLRPGATIFEPAYAEFTAFPPDMSVGPGVTTATVLIDPPSPPGGVTPPIPVAPVWGFITVTNNDTQHITTITPQP